MFYDDYDISIVCPISAGISACLARLAYMAEFSRCRCDGENTDRIALHKYPNDSCSR